MLDIQFEGWFQCRFPTDPDPSDELRGLTGPTFAGPGEPNLDRIIRFNNFKSLRWPRTQQDGVKIRQVLVDNQPVPNHPLVGGKVNLLGNPQFYQNNQILIPTALQTLIDPFILQFKHKEISIEREDLLDVVHPEYNYGNVFLDPTLLNRRLNTIVIQSPITAEATGIMNYEEYRIQRAKDLTALLKECKDPTERAALQKRINAIHKDKNFVGVMLASTQFLGLLGQYNFNMNGTSKIIDPNNKIGGTIGCSQAWPLSFWMGAYDVDTMFGFLKGTLSLPFFPECK